MPGPESPSSDFSGCAQGEFTDVAEAHLSLLTFKRKYPTPGVSVIDSIRAINRQLERKFPDCTCAVVVTAGSGKDTERVTISLDITQESSTSLDWYRDRAEADGLALTGFERGRGTDLEPELHFAFLSPR